MSKDGEAALETRGRMYDALIAHGVYLALPEQDYALTTLLNMLLEAWDRDREIADSCREVWKHNQYGGRPD